jgi:hypothetical protein
MVSFLAPQFNSKISPFLPNSHRHVLRPGSAINHWRRWLTKPAFSPPQKANENIAFILGALTSVGGITGYVRTGSVPSIAAGLTVGALVSFFLPASPS